MKQRYLITCSRDAEDIDHEEIIFSDGDPDFWTCEEIAAAHDCDFWTIQPF